MLYEVIIAPLGKISVAWQKMGESILLDVEIPEGMKATLTLPRGYAVKSMDECKSELTSGKYEII